MKHIGIFKADTWISFINQVGVPLFFVYLICMIIAPWFVAGGGWEHVQNVWDRWQSLNVGILAFASSIVAFNISRSNENRRRERNFIAARAFLPEALSELISYFKSSSSLLREALESANDNDDKVITPLHTPTPDLPARYKETFSRCIESADPDVGEYLAYMLIRLQIHHSRLQELAAGGVGIGSHNIITYLHALSELQALANRIFPFARGREEFKGAGLTSDEYHNAYGNLDIWGGKIRDDNFDDLAKFSQRVIARNSSNNAANSWL